MKQVLKIAAILAAVGLLAATPAQAETGGHATSLSGELVLWPSFTHSKSNADTAAVVTETIGAILSEVITSGTNPSAFNPQMNALLIDSVNDFTAKATRSINLSAATNNFADVVSFSKVNFIAIEAGTNSYLRFGAEDGEAFLPLFSTSEDYCILYPNGAWMAYSPAGYAVEANTKLYVTNRTIEVDGIYEQAYLGIDDGIATSMKTTNEITYSINGTNDWTKAATTNIKFSAADTINIGTNAWDTYGVWLVQIDSEGAITTKSPATNQVYTNAASAITNLPAVDADNVSLGYVLVYSPTSTTFTANTTELTTNNATFVDSATNAPTYASYRLYIGGVAGTNSKWKKVR